MRREISQKVDSQISPTEAQNRFQSAARFGASLFRRTRSASLLGVTLSAGALGAVAPQHKAEAYLSVGPNLLGTASSLPELVNSEEQQNSSNGISVLLTSVNPQVASSMAPLQANTWDAQENANQSSGAVFGITPKVIAQLQLIGKDNAKADNALIPTIAESNPSNPLSLEPSASTSLLSDAVPPLPAATDLSVGNALTPADTVSSAQELLPSLNSSAPISLETPASTEKLTVPVVPIAASQGFEPTALLQPQAPSIGASSAENTVSEKPIAVVHTVQKGENLTEIARKYQVLSEAIVAANQISDPNVIEVQSELVIPAAQPLPDKTPLLLGSWVDNTKVVSKAISQMGVASALLAPQRWPKADLTSAQSLLPTVQTVSSQSQALAETQRQSDKVPKAYWNPGQTASATSEPLALAPRATGATTSYNSGAMVSLVARRSTFPQIPMLELPSLAGAEKFLPSTMGGSQQFIWPAKGVFTSAYGWRWGRMHRGIDVAGPVGTPIVAAASGIVITAGWNSGGYGNMVEVQHQDGSITRYAHNSAITTRVGAVVQQGELIAHMGSTGFSTGPHLHFEIHPHGQGAVDPMAFLARS